MFKRRLRRLSAWCVVIAFGCGLGTLAYVALLSDLPRPDDSDLLVERRELDAAANAFELLLSQGVEVYWPGEYGGESMSDPLEECEAAYAMQTGQAWSAPVAEKIIRKNRAALDCLDRSLTRVDLQSPADYSENVFDSIYYLSEVQKLRCRLRIHRGEDAGALEEALRCLEFYSRLQKSQGALAQRFTTGSALQLLRRIASEGDLTPQQLRDALRHVAGSRPRLDVAVELLQIEYQWLAGFVDDIAAGEPVVWDVGSPNPYTGFWNSFLFQPNKTLAVLASDYRTAIRRVKQGDLVGAVEKSDGRTRDLSRFGRLNFIGHQVGKVLYESVSQRLLQDNLEYRFTEVFLSLRIHQLVHDALPETLDALVPRYLERVPVDPFAKEQSLSYDPVRKVLYSVGPDGNDDGGSLASADFSTSDSSIQWYEEGYDPTVHLTFAAQR